MTRRSAIAMGMLFLAAGGAFLFQRCGEDVPEAGSSRRPSDGATPPPGLAPGGLRPGGPPPPPESTPAGPREVPASEACPPNTRTRGRVIDEADGRPIAGATVQGEAFVENDICFGPSATTDAQGRYDVEVLNDDGCHLKVSAPGYRGRFVYRHPTGSDRPLLLRRENRARVRLRLTGDVSDGDRFRVFRGDDAMTVGGTPFPWGWHPTPPPALEAWDPEVHELTVQNGGIELPELLEPGVARLFVAGDRGSAGPIWVHVPGRAGTLDVPLRVLPKARVEVLVTRAGEPVERVSLLLSAEGFSRDLAAASTDAAGHAWVTGFDVPGRTVLVVDPVSGSVPLPDGASRLPIELEPFEAARDAWLAAETARTHVPPASDPATGALIPLPAPHPLPPNAADAPAPSSVPIAGRLVGVFDFEAWPPLEFGFPTAIRWPVERGPHGRAPRPVQCSFGGPDFTFDILSPGRYLLVLRCGALVAASDGPVEVRSGETTDVGTLPLRRGAVLLGRVLDVAGAPRPFTRVVVTDEGGALDLATWTDPDGGYRVEGLWPGVFAAAVGVEGEPGFARADARVAGSAEHRLDLRPAAPR